MGTLGRSTVFRTLVVSATTVAVVATMGFTVEPSPVQTVGVVDSQAASNYQAAQAHVVGELVESRDAIADLSTAIRAAQRSADGADGHVLSKDKSSLTKLQKTLADARLRLDSGIVQYRTLRQDAMDALDATHRDRVAVNAATWRLMALTTPSLSSMKATGELLATQSDSVEKAVKAWHAEQKRIEEAKKAAAKKAAAKRAAEQRAAQQAAAQWSPPARSGSSGGGTPAAPTASSPAPAPKGPSVTRVHVRTWVDVNNAAAVQRAQAAVNAGGQVAINYQMVGMVVVSAHDYNDSTALRLRNGQLVQFSGALSGTYRVSGDIWVKAGATTSSLRALGTPVAMQTCDGPSMRVVGLVRVS